MTTGRFLGYTATDKNVYYIDDQTRRIKITTYCTFDEAAMTLPTVEQPPSAKALQQLGYPQDTPHDTESEYHAEPEPTLKIRLLSNQAKMPTKTTSQSVGYDLYSARQLTVEPGHRALIPIDIAVTPPPGTYIQIASRSDLATKHQIDTTAGVIDVDYTGNLTVVLHNSSQEVFKVEPGDRIAQMLIIPVLSPTATQVDALEATQRGPQGSGSTGISAIVRHTTTTDTDKPLQPQEPTRANETVEIPYTIIMSQDPFDNIHEASIHVKGDHPTLGMQFQLCPNRNRLMLTNMAISTPGGRILKWRSTLRNAYLLAFNEHSIANLEQLEQAVQIARKNGVIKATCKFATDRSHGVHPNHGIPQLYFDQLNTIAKHLLSIKQDDNNPTVRTTSDSPTKNPSENPTETPPNTPTEPPPPPSPNPEPVSTSFTLKQKQRTDWPQWKDSKYKMLNQYKEQGMFSDPMPLPSNANALRMLWTYLLKICGTRKSRMVCNGSTRQKGTVTLGHTYANSLEAASERLFWSIVAQEGLLAIGADVSNAFAEAPPPKAPLYLYIDDTYREWWTEHLGNPPIPAHCNVVRVHNAIQGHPESPRLWEKHIHQILKELGLRATTHAPCMYTGVIDNNRILFLRQVDDFAVAAQDEHIANTLLNKINAKMRIQLKILGPIDRFNGLDVHQTKHYIKITCEKYLYKAMSAHTWIGDVPIADKPTPLPSDNAYIQALEAAKPPNTTQAQADLKAKMGFNYRQVIGEIIYPMMKCRPDIAFHATKLSQYMENPAEAHYIALQQVCRYLAKPGKTGYIFGETNHEMISQKNLCQRHTMTTTSWKSIRSINWTNYMATLTRTGHQTRVTEDQSQALF